MPKSCSGVRVPRWPVLRLVALGGLLLALLWGVLLWDFQRHAEFDYADNRREVESVTQLGAHALLSTVRSIDLILLDLREHWQLDPGDFDRKVALRQAEARIGIPFAISVIGPDGRVAYSSANPAAIGTELSDQPYVGSNGDNRAYGDLAIIGPIESTLSGGRTLQFARPLRTPEGRVAGAVALSVPPDYLMQVVRSIHFQENTIVTVIRDDGSSWRTRSRERTRRPAQPGPPTTHALAASAPPPAVAMLSQLDPRESGFSRIRSPADQIERLSSWQKLAPYPLTLIVGEQAIPDRRRDFADFACATSSSGDSARCCCWSRSTGGCSPVARANAPRSGSANTSHS